MPPRPIINDALWKCLCPRYSQAAVGSRSASRNSTSRRTAIGEASGGQSRTYVNHTSPTAKPFADGYFNSSHASNQTPPSKYPGRNLKEKTPLVHLSLPELYERLRFDGAAGRHEEVMNIVSILIKDRRERPNAHMYTAILHSFANCTQGTAGKVRKVLDEMETAGVELDGRGAECVLEALAVHPDYLLRTDILEYMRARWFTLSDRAQNFVVAGMLRDRLFEQALEKLDDMIKQQAKVEGWLWDKTMWMLLEYGEVEEAFYVLSLRQNVEGPGVKLSNVLWQQLLDAAAKRHLAEATATIWNTQVTPGYLKPPTGTCVDALSVAARSGDVKLATDVFHVLAERGIALTAHHYEALIESYLSNDDLYAALTVVLYMHDSVLKVSSDALHPLFTYLSKKAERPVEAFTILQGFNDREKKTVPVAAVNTCIHASVVQDRLAEAIDLYKALHTACKAGPNAHTFNILLGGCHRQGRKELAMYLAGEMIERSIAPDRLTYDRLIIVCLNAGDVNDALLYYEEMKAEGFEARRTTHENLMKASVEKGDARAVVLFRDYRERGGVEWGKVGMFERMVAEKFEGDEGMGGGGAAHGERVGDVKVEVEGRVA
jgi:pentatricopeptide repeat protein